MKTLNDVAERLLGKAQNEADVKELHGEYTQAGRLAQHNMLLFIEMADIINKHISDCPLCKP